MTARSSRHDHFPRAEIARRRGIRDAIAAADVKWRIADRASDGLLTAIDALGDAPPDTAIARLLPWLGDTDWLRERLDAQARIAERTATGPSLEMHMENERRRSHAYGGRTVFGEAKPPAKGQLGLFE